MNDNASSAGIGGPMRSQLFATWTATRRVALLAGLIFTAVAAALSSAVVGGARSLAASLALSPAAPQFPRAYRPFRASVSAIMSVARRLFSLLERAASLVDDRIRRFDVALAKKL